MQAEIERLLQPLGGRTTCVVRRKEAGSWRELVAIRAEETLPAASLAKLPILVEVARQAETGERFSWETQCPTPDAARVASDGVLTDLAPDLRLRVTDLAHLMIAISDNTASNVLLDLAGSAQVNAAMGALGLTHTRLERRFLDFAARRAGRDNWTSAADIARLFALLCDEKLPGSARVLRILLRQNDNNILPAYWDEEARFAHKTGGLPGILHDAGIWFPHKGSEGAVIIAALTAEQADVPLTQLTLARVGRFIYEACQNNLYTKEGQPDADSAV